MGFFMPILDASLKEQLPNFLPVLQWSALLLPRTYQCRPRSTAVQLVFNTFSQFVSQLELYSQLQLSLWSDLIALGVPNSTYWVLVKIQGAVHLYELDGVGPVDNRPSTD